MHSVPNATLSSHHI